MVKFKTGISFDEKFLNNLKDIPSSGVEIEKTTHHLALHPIQLNDFKKSVKDILNEGIAKYNRSLGGILLGYQNIKLPTDVGLINYDSCYIHMDLEADFFVFKPEIGKEMQGIVNRKSKDHVGVLVYNTFNVSIPKPSSEQDWMGSSVNIGYEIMFKIICIDFSSCLPYIRGELTSIISKVDGVVNDGKENNVKNRKNRPNKKIVFNDEEIDEMSNHKEESTKKKHKNKKRKTENFEDIMEEEHIKKKKKHKKHFDSEGGTAEVKVKKKKEKLKSQHNDSSLDESNLNVKVKKKKEKLKNRHNDSSLDEFNLNELFNESKLSQQTETEHLSLSDIKTEMDVNDETDIKTHKKKYSIKLEKSYKSDRETDDLNDTIDNTIKKKKKHKIKKEYTELSQDDINISELFGTSENFMSNLESDDLKSSISRKRGYSESLSEVEKPLKKRRYSESLSEVEKPMKKHKRQSQ